jgi:hypothetical protein
MSEAIASPAWDEGFGASGVTPVGKAPALMIGLESDSEDDCMTGNARSAAARA